MKNKRKTNKLASLIESDRLLLSKEASSLICYDLKKLLENYFASVKDVSIDVLADNSKYVISIKGEAVSIKSFKTIK